MWPYTGIQDIEPRTSDIRVRCPTDCATRPGPKPWSDQGLSISPISTTYSDQTVSEEFLKLTSQSLHCTARQCSPLRRKFIECSINSPALSVLIKHLVIGQRQKAPNFSAFHWSPHCSLVSIGQHFVTTKVVHLPKRIKTSLITESD